MDSYEKKYKEALEKARQLCAYPTSKPFISDLQDIFPELTESNDERIRKELIDAILGLWDNDALPMPLSVKRKDEWIAWLEKQGEERTINYPIEGMFPYTDPADTLDGEIENIWNKLRNCDNTFTAAKSGFYEVIHHFATWLEKQCYTKKDVDDAYLKGICDTKHELEKQGEQESADKHEPKFNVGDWITNGDYTWKVIKVEQFDYILQSQDGNIVDDTISYVDKQFHSFTIKDAKDGDVLVTDEMIVLFKKKLENDSALTYFNYDTIDNECESGCQLYYANIYPATKEQCDTLFSKMKDAGYEWSEETHELKKISQRIISAEAKEALYDKPTWSEEDVKKIDRANWLIEHDASHGWIRELREDAISGLKSLRQKIKL